MFEATGQVLYSIWSRFFWVILPVAAFFIYRTAKHNYEKTVKGPAKWKLLEVRVPKDMLKTPKAMEQVFSAAYGVDDKISFEILGKGGEARFLIRLPEDYKNLIESSVYAQYPDAEIYEVAGEDDYINGLPGELPDEIYDIYGVELKLKNKDPYPIRTYPAFEENVEERRVDSIAALLEAISKLHTQEQVWIQIILQPAKDKLKDTWKKEAEEIINKFIGKKEKPTPPLFGITGKDVMNAVWSSGPPEEEKKKDDKKPDITSGQKDIMKAIEEKLAKFGFKATIRIIYFGPHERFSKNHIIAVSGSFRQFNTQNMNSFEEDKEAVTAIKKGFRKEERAYNRKTKILAAYRSLFTKDKSFILNTEELATIYHFPITGTGASSLTKVSSKKGGPPSALPIIE